MAAAASLSWVRSSQSVGHALPVGEPVERADQVGSSRRCGLASTCASLGVLTQCSMLAGTYGTPDAHTFTLKKIKFGNETARLPCVDVPVLLPCPAPRRAVPCCAVLWCAVVATYMPADVDALWMLISQRVLTGLQAAAWRIQEVRGRGRPR